VATAGSATLHFDGGVVAPASLLFSILVWLAAVVFLVERRLGGPWQLVRLGRRRIRAGGRAGGTGSRTDPGEVEQQAGETVP
jgi:hypothetical protein